MFKTLKITFAIFFSFLNTVSVFSQQSSQDYYQSVIGQLNSVSGSSPTAASLGKYGDIPVNYHTGIPQISIPLYTIKYGPITLPIGLNYHGSGLQVMEPAGWVGTGWSLDAGGVITRTIRGVADERGAESLNVTNSYFTDYGFFNYFISDFGQGYAEFQKGVKDDQPDLFFFNFNGYSGKFYFRDDRQPVIVSEQDLKIEYDYVRLNANGMPQSIQGFNITTPDGLKYHFGGHTNPFDAGPVEISIPHQIRGTQTPFNVISSWYLSDITSPDGQFQIKMQYDVEQYSYPMLSMYPQRGQDGLGGSALREYGLVKEYIDGKRLKSITYAGSKIDFNPTAAPREDLASFEVYGFADIDKPNTVAKALGSIVISNSTKELKRYNFDYDYFFDNTTNLGTYLSSSDIYTDKKRLKLNSLQEIGGDGTSKPAYQFRYFDEQVPRRLSFGRDHWGFINGANQNSKLIASFTAYGVSRPGADRDTHWPAMRGGSLRQIIYPTGGDVSFVFEPNSFWIQPTLQNADVGGMRIKTITKNNVNGVSEVTHYSYEDSDPTHSSAILYSQPTIVQVIKNKAYGDARVYYKGCPFSTITGQPFNYFYQSPTSLRPMETTQGYHIGYSQVKVSQDNNGYAIYRYYGDAPQTINHNDVVNRNLTAACADADVNYPEAPLPFNPYRGELRSVGYFNPNGNEIKSIEYYPIFTESKVSTPGFVVEPSPTDTGVSLMTHYDMKSYWQSLFKTIERTRDQNGQNEVVSTTISHYDSPYHHQLSQKEIVNSLGETLITNYTYPPDYRLSDWVSLSDGYIPYTSAVANANRDYSALVYCGDKDDVCGRNLYVSYVTALATARKSYITTLRTNFTDATSNFNKIRDNIMQTSADGVLKPVLQMQINNIIKPIEVTSWKNGNLLNAAFTKFDYSPDVSTTVYPRLFQGFKPSTFATAFTPSAIAGNSTIVKDSRYDLPTASRVTVDYKKGNIVQVTKENQLKTSYIWGYSNAYPVATVQNAAANEIYYQGFEEQNDYSKVALDAAHVHTGKLAGKIYNPNSSELVTASTTVLAITPGKVKKFRYSGWVYSDGPSTQIYLFMRNAAGTTTTDQVSTSAKNKWTMMQKDFDVPADITQLYLRLDNNEAGTVWFDDLQLYPADADMTTANYEPLIGVTSTMDAKNQVTGYEYDGLQRLQTVRDQNGNILKNYQYGYAPYVPNVKINWIQQEYSDASNFVDANIHFYINDTNQETEFYTGTGSFSGGKAGDVVNIQQEFYPSYPWPPNSSATMIIKADGAVVYAHTVTDHSNHSYNLTLEAGKNYEVSSTTTIGAPPSTGTVYVKMLYENEYINFRYTRYDLVAYFYSDPACTQPVSVNNLSVNYKQEQQYGGTSVTNYTALCNGTSYTLKAGAITEQNTPDGYLTDSYMYTLTPGTGYEIR